MIDDEDEFLYGTSQQEPPKTAPQTIYAEPTLQQENGSVAHSDTPMTDDYPRESRDMDRDEQDMGEDEVELGDESEEDIEIIMEPVARSLDFRQGPGVSRVQGRPMSTTFAPPKAPQSSTLTTEYTPMQRGGALDSPSQHPPLSTTPSQSIPQGQKQSSENEILTSSQPGIDTSTLPPVTAPPSHPTIEPTVTGVFDGRSILEVDLNAMGDKHWRRPGSDISDWFNYGFDEISWEAYCYRRRDLGEMANVLKTNVLNFSGMPEDQLTALPPEVRTMVMTGTTAMMNQGASAGMMAPGVMMDMSGMMGPMGMGMGIGTDMGMGGAMMQMQDGQTGVVSNGTSEQVAGSVGIMQDGFTGGQAQDLMSMGMGGAQYGIQEQNAMGQPMYPPIEAPTPVAPPVQPVGVPRGATSAPYRGRAQGMIRGRGFSARGRGRGGYTGDGGPPVPMRPASPLPPGVPTGPRNQNKYKDRDGNAPAVDGLDYGKDFGGRTPSGEPEERGSRKRRPSPGIDDGRGPKRR